MKNAALTALALVSGAAAHEWYDPWCCNATDCQPIPSDTVQITSQGYRITLRSTDHTSLLREPADHTYLIPFKQARVSQDGR